MTDSSRTIASLFTPPPPQWSNRGDPHLWNAMAAHFAATPLPATAEQLVAAIRAGFAELAGRSLDEPQPFFVPRFAHGGLTSGYVAAPFWRSTLVPLLLARFATPPG